MKKTILHICLLLAVVAVRAADYSAYYTQLPTSVKPVEPVVIPTTTISLTETGGVGDGVTLCTDAFAKAIDQLAAKGGGRLVVPQGVWLTGPIELKSNTELHLDRNAIVYFSPDKRLYLDKKGKASRGLPCISANRCTNIAITGQGIIDGNGQQWRPVKRSKMSDVEWKAYLDMGGQVNEKGDLWYPWQMKSGYPDVANSPQRQEALRNDLVRLTDCKNVLVEGVTLQNSPRFHLHPCYCENVIIDGVTVRAPWNVQNADGIDLSDCHRVLVVNATVNVGDDGICLKSGKPRKNSISGCEDILVHQCTVYHAHGGFVLGSETVAGMRNIVARQCRFAGTDVGLRFKSGAGRGGKTERLYVSDIVMSDIKDEAVIFQCDYVNRPAGNEKAQAQQTLQFLPDFQDIHISNVVCRGCHTAIKASGIEDQKCVHDIELTNCTIVYDKTGQQIDSQTAQLKLNNVRLVKNECKE